MPPNKQVKSTENVSIQIIYKARPQCPCKQTQQHLPKCLDFHSEDKNTTAKWE